MLIDCTSKHFSYTRDKSFRSHNWFRYIVLDFWIFIIKIIIFMVKTEFQIHSANIYIIHMLWEEHKNQNYFSDLFVVQYSDDLCEKHLCFAGIVGIGWGRVGLQFGSLCLSLLFVQLFDRLDFFLQFHSSILEPYLDLAFSQTQRVGHFYPPPSGQVVVCVELFLQF